MQTAAMRSEYLGALIEDERRLVLVSVDPEDPWQAFRTMRRMMRKEPMPAEVALFDAPAPLEHQAEIISLASRRRAG